tara:strand:+ start:2906 stop:3382 length:477 start_codon:yes stop_codon:yes gene_type:complete
MSGRVPNYRKVKIHRSYTVDETARTLDVHKNTVRQWLKNGLSTIDDRRPLLILGSHLAAYLKERRANNKRPCKPGEIYCVRCRKPQRPAGNMADYEPLTATTGNLIGICPVCDTMIYRRVNYARLDLARGTLEVQPAKALEHIVDRAKPSVNSDFKQE